MNPALTLEGNRTTVSAIKDTTHWRAKKELSICRIVLDRRRSERDLVTVIKVNSSGIIPANISGYQLVCASW